MKSLKKGRFEAIEKQLWWKQSDRNFEYIYISFSAL